MKRLLAWLVVPVFILWGIQIYGTVIIEFIKMLFS